MAAVRQPASGIQWIIAAIVLFMVYSAAPPARRYIVMILALIIAGIVLKGGIGTQLYDITKKDRRSTIDIKTIYGQG